jgi:DNA polymerase-3 subunit delta
MAFIDAQKFYKSLESRQFAPIYFLFGDEPYLLNQSVNRFKHAILNEGAIDFNFSLFYSGDVDIEVVRDGVETLPMMAPRRLVVLKEAQELSDKEWAALESIIETPVDSTVFVILASRIDKRKKQIRLLLDKADCVEFKKPYENKMPSWINYIAQSLGLSISNDGINLLHRLVGNHLTEVEAELIKVGEFIGSQRRIEVADIAQVVSRSKEESVFDFTKAIGENDRVKALEHLVFLLDQGQNEVGIVSLVARHVRILLMLKRGEDEGLRGAKLAHYAQVQPYFLESYLDQARLWTTKKLEQTLLVLAETDRALKSSPLSSHIWLENMVLKTCGAYSPINLN